MPMTTTTTTTRRATRASAARLSFKLLLGIAALMAVLSVSRTSQAAGSYYFCARWAYTFIDQGYGRWAPCSGLR